MLALSSSMLAVLNTMLALLPSMLAIVWMGYGSDLVFERRPETRSTARFIKDVGHLETKAEPPSNQGRKPVQTKAENLSALVSKGLGLGFGRSRPWFRMARPWFRPWFRAARPWFQTVRPWFRPWFQTLRPWFGGFGLGLKAFGLGLRLQNQGRSY